MASPADASYEEIEYAFEKLVKLCTDLQSQDRFHSGFQFVITEQGTISAVPIPPDTQEGGTLSNLMDSMQHSLTMLHELRYSLAQWFDLNSDAWNASSVGRMLAYVEHTFRHETYRVQDNAQGKSSKPYNAYTIVFVAEELRELAMLVSSRSFARKWRWNKLRAMNDFAQRFFKRNTVRTGLQQVGASIELILAMNELRKTRGTDPAFQKLVRNTTQTGLHDALTLFLK